MRSPLNVLAVLVALSIIAGCASPERAFTSQGPAVEPGTYEGNGLQLVLRSDATFSLRATTPSAERAIGAAAVVGFWNPLADRILAVGSADTPPPQPQNLLETHFTSRAEGLSIHVIDDATGAPVEGAIVALTSSLVLEEPYIKTDEHGSASIPTRPTDTLLVRPMEYFERQVVLPSAGVDSVVVPVVADPDWDDIHSTPMLRLHILGQPGGVEVYKDSSPYFLEGEAGLERLTDAPLERVE